MKTATLKRPFSIGFILYFFFLANAAFAQWTAPGFTIEEADRCKGTITVRFAAWYSNGSDGDTDDDAQLKDMKITINDIEIWDADFDDMSGDDNSCAFSDKCGGCDSAGTGDGGEDVHDSWDCGEYITWDISEDGWKVYNYGPTPKENNDGVIYDEQVMSVVNNPDDNNSDDVWVVYELELGPIPDSWYNGEQITVKVEGEHENLDYGPFTQTFSFDEVPTPSGFTATTASNNGRCDDIKLSWGKPSGESCNIDYFIQYRTINGNWEELTTIEDEDQLEYIHDGLQSGVEYEYRIQTILNGGVHVDKPKSVFSSVIEGSTLPSPPPPTAFTASTDNCDQIVNLSWQYNPGVGNGELQSFIIYRDNNFLANVSLNDRSYQDDVPERGVDYEYTIVAVNQCGNGEDSEEITGTSPLDPPTPSSISTAVEPGVGIRINWTPNDPKNIVDEYRIERNLLGGGGSTILGPINPDVTTFLDESVVACQTYEYRIIAVNDCKPEGIVSQEKAEGKLVPDLSNTFEGTALLSSKGYFSQRVELAWTVENNQNIINAFKVYRRDLNNQAGDFIQIASLNSGSNLYVDDLVDAAKLYEYAIIGEAQCEQTTVYSDTIRAIGFRTPFGTVTGNVNYSGGTAVKGVKISAESTAQIEGHSVALDGNSALEVPPHSSLHADAAMCTELWFYPNTYEQDFSLMKKTGVFDLKYDKATNQYRFDFQYNSGSSGSIGFDAGMVALDNYHHIAAQVHEDSIKLFIDNQLIAKEFITSGVDIDERDEAILLGQGFKGLLTEVRYWTSGRADELIFRDASRHLVGGETGLKVYLKTIEGQGGYAYDASKINGNFNRNHAKFIGTPEWSDNIPTISQLGNTAYTNEEGIYVLNIPYNGVGENFVLTPSLGTHEFDPASRALFIGDGATIQNNIDFLDKSSFRVTGNVVYDGTTCSVPDVLLKIDGEIAVLDGAPIATDAAGNFDLQVPIGNHHISLEKAGHVFSEGRFPPSGKYDFQEDLAGIAFKDATRVKIVGRVVGGSREAGKIPGLGKSINNIGIAEIILESQQGGGCFIDTVRTDLATGEYSTEVPPLRYIPSVAILNNNDAISFTENGPLELVDLTSTPILKTRYDTIYSQVDSSVVQIDSVKFHKQLDYIYRAKPSLSVTGRDGVSDFIGDTTYTYLTPTGDTIVRDLRTDPFNWPVFSQKNEEDYLYRCMIRVFEEYHNYDNPQEVKIDSVPTVDGRLVVENELSHIDSIILRVSLDTVARADTLISVIYSFQPGSPSFAVNNSIPEYSFTKKLQIYLETVDNQIVAWEPVDAPPTGGDQLFRGYLLGKRSNGEQFVTTGPEVPDYILRDPPGSNSFASREAGTTRTEETSWNWNLGAAAHTSDNIFLGSRFNVGLGVSTATDIENNNTAGLSVAIGGGREGSQTSTTTNTQTWNTNVNTDVPGKGSDLYVGKAENMQFGISEELAIVPDSLCNQIECLEIPDIPTPLGDGYSFAKKYGLSAIQKGYETTFFYDENYIKNYLIPDLEFLRNTYMETNPKYTIHLDVDDPNYGKNNDDPVFGDDATDKTGYDVLSGQSYTFEYDESVVENMDPSNPAALDSIIQGDKVRFYNLQIIQWERAIWLNEWEKANINNQEVLDSLREKELDDLFDENKLMLAAYAAATVGGAAGVSAAYGTIATPIPGTAFAGYASFATTTAASIAQSELTDAFNRYQNAKDRINDKYDSITETNYTINGGNSITSSITHDIGTSVTNSIELAMTAEFSFEVNGKVNNNGVGLEKGVSLEFSSGRDWTTETTESETVSFTIDDPDQGDAFSVDVYPSLFGWGAIFKKRAGGQTSCPHEPEEVTEYYEPGKVISHGTQQIDKPRISAAPSKITNVPVDEAAVFNLTLTNESESGDGRIYEVSLVSSSNPFGALVSIDGGNPNISVVVPADASINKVIAVEKGPGMVYDYDSLLFVIYAPCQYEAGTSDNIDIVDSTYISASFIPTCTDVELFKPEDQWVLNNSSPDTLDIEISDYNINFFDFQSLRFDYKPSSESSWISVKTFYKDTTGIMEVEPEIIPTNTFLTSYDWVVSSLPDGYYDLRVVSECALANKESITYSGIMDRINPHPFGHPSPADGILEPNDEISIKFNEPIDLGSLTSQNFDIRGVLNGTETSHSTSLYFDGVDDYVEVDGGAALRQRDFTISFAAKRDGTGEQAIISQGTDIRERIFVGFNASDQFVFRIGEEEVASAGSYTDDQWRYYTVSYSHENETAELFVVEQSSNGIVNTGNTSIFTDYQGSGKLIFGKNSVSNAAYFRGHLHDVRIWGTALSASENTVHINKLLSRNEIGLLYNWRMDEADGDLLVEHVRRRDAINYGATWTVEPGGHAVELDGGDDYLKVKAADVAITQNMDFTLEFWFNSTQPGEATLFSNGTGNSMEADSLLSWNISKDFEGKIHVRNYGNDWIAVEEDYFDGEWHHFALVLQRTGNLSAYIDGDLQNATQALPFKQFGGSHLYLGARGYNISGAETVEQHFAGSMDEFRFWNTARTLEQVRRDKQNRMMADEFGLLLYLPFEDYELQNNVPVLMESFAEQVNDTLHTVENPNMAVLIDQTPTIKLQRPVESIAFTFSVNNDEIIFTPSTSPERIENVTLDITVKNVKDLQGNVMESPETWIAYIDKNQVAWQDDLLVFEKETETELEFTSAIINSGGSAKDFEILNVPEWLTIDPSSGTIAPNSVLEVEFEVDPLVNIGDYVEDLQLLTDFGYPEKLTVDLKVRDKEPDWEVDPSDYQYSMSIIGLLRIRDIASTDEEDLLAAFVGDQARGKAHVQYIEDLDRYLVFMDVYSNKVSGEELTFKIWDANAGIIYTEVLPELIPFNENSVIGTLGNPQVFETSTKVIVDIPLDEGWNWVSHFLLNPDSTDLDITLESLNVDVDYLIKSQENYSAVSDGKWIGPLQNDGIRPEKMYKLRTSQIDTLRITGEVIDPRNRTINLVNNWNWLGYISIRNQSVEQALGNLNATDGDLIKGASQFAVYDSLLAEWVGSLQTMVPGSGYMYRSQGAKSFTYPLAGMFRNEPGAPELFTSEWWPVHRGAYNSNMTAITSLHNNCGIYLDSDEYAIGLFDEQNNCRGLMSVAPAVEDVHFLTISGEGIESLDFRLLNLLDGQEFSIGQEFEFISNQHQGSMQAPYIIELSGQLCEELEKREELKSIRIKTYPTVFTDFVQVDFYAGQADQQASIVVYNAQGQPLINQPVGVVDGYNTYRLQMEQQRLPAGVYFLSLRAGGQTYSTRIIKQ
jgi:hypothetical protein